MTESAETRFAVPQSQLTLQRLPRRPRELLRAWDAADEYLLQHLDAENLPGPQDRLLILNDSFGALSLALHDHDVQAVSDSWLSHEATRLNAVANDLNPESIRLLSSLDEPTGPLDLVLIKIPKTLALLEDQLIRLRPHIGPETKVIAAAMVKALPANAWKLMERIIGPTRPGRAVKKARLIFVTPDMSNPCPVSPYPRVYTLEKTDYRLTNHANVFSRDSLDIGTRLFLKNIPTQETAREIIDLGCGNGVVGLIAAARNPQARLHFADESYMAIASAKATFMSAFGDARQAQFHIGNALERFDENSADLILCNPPFHQQQAVGNHIASSMFSQASRVLRSDGEFWVIGNRHLGYHQLLKRWFSSVKTVSSDRKFVVLKAVLPKSNQTKTKR